MVPIGPGFQWFQLGISLAWNRWIAEIQIFKDFWEVADLGVLVGVNPWQYQQLSFLYENLKVPPRSGTPPRKDGLNIRAYS